MSRLVPKRKIHFIGFLANVDDSILKLNLGHPFAIEKKSQQDVIPFLRHIDMHWGVEERFGISAVEKQGDILVRGQSFYCITARNLTSFEGTPQGGVVGKRAEVKRIAGSIRDKIRLLRLYKGGNILLDFLCMYYIKNSEPSVIWMGREDPIADRTEFVLSDSDIMEAQSFIKDTTIPFRKSFLQLAFEVFELSYEVHDLGLAFLSLMIALEVMFTKEREGLSYGLARNTAVLLGESEEKADSIFNEVRNFCRTRGNLVHAGKKDEIKKGDVLKLRDYVRKAIKDINTIGKGKDEILDTLKACGFGQRLRRK
jgi:hypothetical protein